MLIVFHQRQKLLFQLAGRAALHYIPFRAAQLGEFRQPRRAAEGDKTIRHFAHRRVSADPREPVRSAALHADFEVGERDVLPLGDGGFADRVIGFSQRILHHFFFATPVLLSEVNNRFVEIRVALRQRGVEINNPRFFTAEGKDRHAKNVGMIGIGGQHVAHRHAVRGGAAAAGIDGNTADAVKMREGQMPGIV